MRAGNFIIAVALLACGVFLYETKSSTTAAPSALDYFKGTWTVTLKSNAALSFRWTVREELKSSWLVGVVEQNGEKVSTDFWREDGHRIERFAFTSGGLYVKVESAGWDSGRLLFTGVMSDKTGETRVRETITKVNDHEFRALWEMENPQGRWVVFSDETCEKQ
ncbi:MAG TPA: hypothetical protein VJT74_14140 [Pyrinomonadaceae bacterium]|nr:hypothetical protein [Pyrinomonadaceae bacterium]